jgi:hypothetical protein
LAAVSDAIFSATTFASAAALSAITFAAAATHAALQTGSGAGSGAGGATGAAGADGVTGLDAVDVSTDVPLMFIALEVKVYAVPLVNPDTVQEPLAPVTVQVALPGEAVTV